MVPIPTDVINIPGRISSATQELVFKAADLPAFGFKSYYVQKQATEFVELPVSSTDKSDADNKVITN
jgi:hypothetical protein